ncbi:MAG: ribose-5-phosphate isomerase RpiA [Desulfarculaceae bacterium]|nr:ribose-5-phosphate isomerase RpiA [Desulfarculaceae bacterium]MCF8048050.1 ribose-5-phosphate isomerase RpiA [Desulfarculaceae bacterium]MCF8064903.1 ribose-5-phosphate isomerase RpiA [Desulfarculaceae bacterium]MCF8097686.1 ribose-5-phosphate isomerase RpiA [Desulfarculaceae bacterium]MCF8123716.1 ribose-5-phosphate isomerase RpiA [Desulfarculaceae bacterium]
MSDEQTRLKQQAADAAVDEVRSGMTVGLGYGSTALLFVRSLAKKVASGELTDITGVACALAMEAEARSLGLTVSSLDQHPVMDLTVDGADEVDPALNLIKGGGGALLREKVVAQASRREIIIVDDSKMSAHLGDNWALPVEVVPFALRPVSEYVSSLGAVVKLRLLTGGEPLVTDQGNWIIDCNFGPMQDPEAVARSLEGRAGLVDHGLFLGLASEVIVAGGDGIRRITRP